MGGAFILDSLTGFISAKQKMPSLALERYLGAPFPKREDLYLISTSKIDHLLYDGSLSPGGQGTRKKGSGGREKRLHLRDQRNVAPSMYI